MPKIFFGIGLILFIFFKFSYAQQGNTKIGADLNQLRNYQGNYYDYSDPETLNIIISVWGYVKSPGRYLVPTYIKVKDLLSYAGGPTSDAFLDDLRLYRVQEDSTQVFLKFSYNDLIYSEQLTTKKENIPDLRAGDLLLVPGQPKLYYRDYLTLTLSIISTLVSLAILVWDITKK